MKHLGLFLAATAKALLSRHGLLVSIVDIKAIEEALIKNKPVLLNTSVELQRLSDKVEKKDRRWVN